MIHPRNELPSLELQLGSGRHYSASAIEDHLTQKLADWGLLEAPLSDNWSKP